MPVTPSVIRFFGRYSEGLRLTAAHGPTSGIIAEYAAHNAPQGTGRLGRYIDRRFLELRHWRDLRERVMTTNQHISEVLARRRAAGRTTMILDLASGTARYLRDVVREQGADDLVVACHDRDPRQVMLGRELIAREVVPGFTFSVGDATDHASYLTSRDPDLMLAIHLFPYLRSDDAVRSVIQLTFEHLSAGGCFICTTQAEPTPGLIYWSADAFGLRPAVRAPATITAWLRQAGFINIDQRSCQTGAFALVAWKPDTPRAAASPR